MSREVPELLKDALAHFELLQVHAERGTDDQMVIDAVCMRLSAGIEVLSGLDAAKRDELFGGSWALMWGMRNRIAHGYLLVDAVIVAQTLEHDVPEIMAHIRKELGETH